MQEFQKNNKLAKHIERMASTGQTGSITEWNTFLIELNQALTLTDVVKPFYCFNNKNKRIDTCGTQCDTCKNLKLMQ